MPYDKTTPFTGQVYPLEMTGYKLTLTFFVKMFIYQPRLHFGTKTTYSEMLTNIQAS